MFKVFSHTMGSIECEYMTTHHHVPRFRIHR